MNDKNDDLNITNHYSPLASDNDDRKLIIKDEILKINNLIKNKFHLPKLDQNNKDKFLDIKKSTFELKKQILLLEKVNFFENRLKETEKLNLEELALVN